MVRTFFLFMAAVLVGIVQAGFVRALPLPFSQIQLPIIMIVGLVSIFRFKEAFTAAVITGLTLDSLSSLPNGAETAVLVLMTAVTALLFSRIFTHHSWLGTVGLNAAIFSLAHLAFVIVGVIRSVFTGLSYSPLPTADSAKAFLSALGIQVALVVVLLTVNGGMRNAFSKRFFLLR